jgi:hypothetical protein
VYNQDGQVKQERKPSLEEAMIQQTETLTKFIDSTNHRLDEQEASMKNQDINITSLGAAIKNLESTVGQLADSVKQRPQGALPSNTELNPKAQLNVITRSGKGEDAGPSGTKEIENFGTEQSAQPPAEGRAQSNGSRKPEKPVRAYTTNIPYPGRIKTQKEAEQFAKFLEMFKQLHVNLPFIEALANMPKYAKFLKDLLTNKTKLEELSTVSLDEKSSALLLNTIPKKLSDSGSFTLPCRIGEFDLGKGLVDTGASINLMPYSVFLKLELGEPKPIRMSIELADTSVKFPKGIVEDVLVKVGKFVFPADFVILDIPHNDKVPLIFGRPFL